MLVFLLGGDVVAADATAGARGGGFHLCRLVKLCVMRDTWLLDFRYCDLGLPHRIVDCDRIGVGRGRYVTVVDRWGWGHLGAERWQSRETRQLEVREGILEILERVLEARQVADHVLECRLCVLEEALDRIARLSGVQRG